MPGPPASPRSPPGEPAPERFTQRRLRIAFGHAVCLLEQSIDLFYFLTSGNRGSSSYRTFPVWRDALAQQRGGCSWGGGPKVMASSVAAPGWGTARAPPPLFFYLFIFSPTSGTFPVGFGSQRAGFPSRETSQGRDGHQGGCCWGCPLGTGPRTQPHGAGGAFQLRSGGDAHKRLVPFELFASPSLPLALSPGCGEASSFCHSTLCPKYR